MSKTRKIILFSVGALIGLLVIATVALRLFVDTNTYKPRLEATASSALGMEVKVDGQLGIGFFPDLRVTLDDVHIRNRGMDVAFAKEARLGIELLPRSRPAQAAVCALRSRLRRDHHRVAGDRVAVADG